MKQISEEEMQKIISEWLLDDYEITAFDCLLASYDTLAKEWNTTDNDEAYKDL